MTIVRVGLAETKHYGDGWNAIFGGKKTKEAKLAKAGAKKKGKSSKKKK